MRSKTNVDEISRLYAEEHVGMVRLAHLMTGSLSIAEEIVQDAFVAVFEHAGWDAPAAIALLDPDADIEVFGIPIEQLGSRYEFLEKVDWRRTVEECNVTNNGPPIRVTCFYTSHNAWSDALGHAPSSGRYFFRITDGRIVKMVNLEGETAWGSIQAWVRLNHLDDLDLMYTSSGRVLYTPESLALWEQYTAEFVAEVGGGS